MGIGGESGLAEEKAMNHYYKINDDGTAELTYNLATGSVVPGRSVGNTINDSLAIKQFTNIPDEFHDIIPIMRKYYENDGLFGTVIDILVQFTIDGAIQNITKDKSAQEFFDAIVETSNLKVATRWAVLDYYLNSNVFPYRTNTKQFKKSRIGKKVPLYEWTILNPDFVRVSGSLLFNRNVISISPSDELIELIKDANKKDIPQFMPASMVRAIKNGDDIELDPDNVFHIARNKQPYQRYAPVALKRVIKPLQVKEKYMQMDLSTANGIINQIVIFKLGSDKFPVLSDEPLKRFHKLLETPSKAYQLVWNHALEVDYIRSDPQALDPAKYGPVNRELMFGFATPTSLIGGETGSYGKDYIAVKGLVERLRWAREDLEAWIEREFRLIAEENNLKTWAKPKLGSVNLEEERTFRQVLVNLFDHGVLSAETLLSESGFEFLTEVEKLKIEKKIKEQEGILLPQSPYQQPKSQPGRPDDTQEDVPRDRRDPAPKPNGANASKISLGAQDSPFEEASENMYLNQLLLLYKNTREATLAGLKKDDLEAIALALISFRGEMESIGTKSIKEMYDFQYSVDMGLDENNKEYNRWLNQLVSWNTKYVDKLFHDLRLKIDESIEKGGDNSEFFVDMVFEKELYRLQMFAREGIRKAKLFGSVASHLNLGYEYGRWVTSFRNSCPTCVERHNQVFPLDEIFQLLPAHNRCECEIEFLQQRGD